MSDTKVTLDEEQLDQLCRTLMQMVSFQNADALEHVLGPCKESISLVSGIHRVADALEAIASVIESKE